MKNPVVMIGVGEMAGVFARGLLRRGRPVVPVTRQTDPHAAARTLPDVEAVIVAVAEKDLHGVLAALPAAWRDKLVLLQNELLPRDWEAHGLEQPTVVAVWFEKKPGQDYKVLIPSPVYGPRAGLIADALSALAIPARIVANAEQMRFELVRKNVYILTTNIAGLETGGTVQDLWQAHQALARRVAGEIMDIQAWLTGVEHDRDALIAGLLEGIEGDPQHLCTGRSAPARLRRALDHADAADLAVPTLRDIARRHLAG